MFKNPFFFKGRIRRTEYGLSLIIYFICAFAVNLISAVTGYTFLSTLFAIPALWFLLAQGTKRCHDTGLSGWYQLIPFFILYLVFKDGEPWKNQYGRNPKDPLSGEKDIHQTGMPDFREEKDTVHNQQGF